MKISELCLHQIPVELSRCVGKRSLLLSVALGFTATFAQAQLVTYNPTGLSNVSTQIAAGGVNANISATALTRGSGLSGVSASNALNSDGFNNSTNFATANSNGDYYAFTLTPAANYSISVTAVSAAGQRSGGNTSQIAQWGYVVGSSTTSLGSSVAVGSSNTTMEATGLSITGVTQSIQFRLAGWNGTSGGTFRLNPSTTVTGSVTMRSAGTLTWDGGQGNGNWNSYNGTAANQSNWNLNNIPSTSLVDTLAFAGSTQTSTSNNLTGLVVGAITFNAGAAAFTNAGNSLTLNGAVTNNSANLQTINHAVVLSNAMHGFNTASGNLAVGGIVSGNGGIEKTGGNQLTLSGNNSYTGGTSLQDGLLVAAHAKALGTGNVNISGDAQLQVSNGILLNIGTGNSVTLTSEEAIYRKNFSNEEGFTNANALRSDLTGGGVDTVAAIRGGSASGTGLFAEMSFRASEEGATRSNILALNGTGNQIIALSLTVGPGLLDSESALGWFDSVDGWVLAVAGNIGAGELAGGYAMSYAAFLADNQGVFDAIAMLGAYGVDVATGEVWAVINHNSDFAAIQAVPEPASAALVAATGVLFVCFRRRHSRA